tara:strand:- start:651 stop:755 length:105 start_codon:yes stop_codon:yes gene_type:complete
MQVTPKKKTIKKKDIMSYQEAREKKKIKALADAE